MQGRRCDMEEKVKSIPYPINTFQTRRSFLDFSIFFSLLVLAAGTIYPIIRFIWPSKRAAERGKATTSIALEKLDIGDAIVTKLLGKPVIVVRTDSEVHALSAVCTHLGCIVKWDKNTQHLVCPCHAATFDLRGNVTGGPAPSPLPAIEAKIVGEQIVIGGA
jgi:cytochrome b6-f complex iron-sulfur subunit